jgi:hypothetical protein
MILSEYDELKTGSRILFKNPDPNYPSVEGTVTRISADEVKIIWDDSTPENKKEMTILRGQVATYGRAIYGPFEVLPDRRVDMGQRADTYKDQPPPHYRGA